MRKSASLLAAAAALSLFAGPAAAQSDQWQAAGAAYASGKESGITPATGDEYMLCAAYWLVWAAESDDGTVPGGEPVALDEGLELDAAEAAVVAFAEQLGEPDEIEDELIGAANEADDRYLAGLAGDTEAWRTFFETLGTCQPPAE